MFNLKKSSTDQLTFQSFQSKNFKITKFNSTHEISKSISTTAPKSSIHSKNSQNKNYLHENYNYESMAKTSNMNKRLSKSYNDLN